MEAREGRPVAVRLHLLRLLPQVPVSVPVAVA